MEVTEHGTRIVSNSLKIRRVLWEKGLTLVDFYASNRGLHEDFNNVVRLKSMRPEEVDAFISRMDATLLDYLDASSQQIH